MGKEVRAYGVREGVDRMTYEEERMRPVRRLVHLMFLDANTAGNEGLWKLFGSLLELLNWSVHLFTHTCTHTHAHSISAVMQSI